MQHTVPLQPGHTYHLYTRGNNRNDVFFEERNYRYFLGLYAKYIAPVADTFAYCLMRNHWHVAARIKTSQVSETCEVSDVTPRLVSQAFSNLLNAYAKAINKAYSRTGSLFEKRFERIEVTSDAYFTNLIFYIHANPQRHGFVDDFRDWPWSSYGALVSPFTTRLACEEVLGWFGSAAKLAQFHDQCVDEKLIQGLIAADFE